MAEKRKKGRSKKVVYSCKCYKCQTNFESDNDLDQDEYSLCPSCLEEKRRFTAELDAKIKPIPIIKKEYRWIPANVPGGKLYLE